MKPSMHQRILAMLGLREEQSVYLADYGHIGAPDKVLELELARAVLRLRGGGSGEERTNHSGDGI
jgi:3-oxoacyl-[acyl-carrier-protein] synthase-3